MRGRLKDPAATHPSPTAVTPWLQWIRCTTGGAAGARRSSSGGRDLGLLTLPRTRPSELGDGQFGRGRQHGGGAGGARHGGTCGALCGGPAAHRPPAACVSDPPARTDTPRDCWETGPTPSALPAHKTSAGGGRAGPCSSKPTPAVKERETALSTILGYTMPGPAAARDTALSPILTHEPPRVGPPDAASQLAVARRRPLCRWPRQQPGATPPPPPAAMDYLLLRTATVRLSLSRAAPRDNPGGR